MPGAGSPADLVDLVRGGREQAREVVGAQRLQARLVGEVEVQGRDGDAAVGDRGEVGAVLVVVAGGVAVDAVALAARLLLLERELVAVDALAEPRDLDAADLPR